MVGFFKYMKNKLEKSGKSIRNMNDAEDRSDYFNKNMNIYPNDINFQNLVHAHNIIKEQQKIMNKQNNYNQIFMNNQEKILKVKERLYKKLSLENINLKKKWSQKKKIIRMLNNINFFRKKQLERLVGINNLYNSLWYSENKIFFKKFKRFKKSIKKSQNTLNNIIYLIKSNLKIN